MTHSLFLSFTVTGCVTKKRMLTPTGCRVWKTVGTSNHETIELLRRKLTNTAYLFANPTSTKIKPTFQHWSTNCQQGIQSYNEEAIFIISKSLQVSIQLSSIKLCRLIKITSLITLTSILPQWGHSSTLVCITLKKYYFLRKD